MPWDNKYLGLPVFIGKDKAKNFVVVKERVSAKVAGWKSKLLLQAGRTTLIKFVATSFPQYYMQSYLVPVGWCKDVNRILKNFWWGLSPDKTHNYMSKHGQPSVSLNHREAWDCDAWGRLIKLSFRNSPGYC